MAFSESHSQIVSDSTAISNPVSGSNGYANSFRDISEGISIANRVPKLLARRRMDLANAQLSTTLISADELSQQAPQSAAIPVLPPSVPSTDEAPPVITPDADSTASSAKPDALSPPDVPPAADAQMSSDRTESGNSAAKSVDHHFLSELTRPMTGINLADALRSETLDGTQLA